MLTETSSVDSLKTVAVLKFEDRAVIQNNAIVPRNILIYRGVNYPCERCLSDIISVRLITKPETLGVSQNTFSIIVLRVGLAMSARAAFNISGSQFNTRQTFGAPCT